MKDAVVLDDGRMWCCNSYAWLHVSNLVSCCWYRKCYICINVRCVIIDTLVLLRGIVVVVSGFQNCWLILGDHNMY